MFTVDSRSYLTMFAKINPMLGLCAVTAVAICSAGGAFFHAAGTARAPEPAHLTSPLTGSSGVTAAAIYLNGTPTKVIKWPSSYASSSIRLTAGQPCSWGDAAAGSQTTHVIVVTSGYYKCQ